MTVIIGLTGSIATGKSTISDLFKQLHIPVVDADKIARDVVEEGQPALAKIVETFGDSVLLDDKSLDRKALGNIVFKDKEKLTMLNKIMHPAIREEMNKQKQVHVDAQTQCVVMDVPLLFENKLTHLVDKIIVVYVDESVQLERLMARDGSTKEEALSRIHTQIPVKDKLDHAHAAINNNGTVEQSYEQLLKILKDWHIEVER